MADRSVVVTLGANVAPYIAGMAKAQAAAAGWALEHGLVAEGTTGFPDWHRLRALGLGP